MDQQTLSKLVNALSEWNPASSSQYVIPTQSSSIVGTSQEYLGKTFPQNIKQEPNVDVPSLPFPGIIPISPSHQYPSNVTMSGIGEVPMDDYDPLENFNFWDGETFYCNQDLDASCRFSPNVPAEKEMVELQDYLIREEMMTHDDLAQINDSDLIRNPTLAELNSCNDTLFECSADNSFLSEDSGYLLSPELLSKSVPASDCNSFMNNASNILSGSSSFVPSINVPAGNYHEPKNPSLLSSSCPVTSQALHGQLYFNPCDDRLLLCPQNSPASESLMQKHENFKADSPLAMPGPSKAVFSPKRLRSSVPMSSSAPMDVVMRVGSPAIKAESPGSSCGSRSADKSLSNFSALSLSNDDESGSYFDSDHEDEDDDDGFSSDDDTYQYDSDENFSTSWPPAKDSKGHSRRNRFFWQYNLQSRGIKSHNLLPLTEEGNPYVLNDVKDPVFAEDCVLPVKHSGKARKGDGNDLTPNPRKLFSIGLELKKLNKMIYNLNPTNEFSPQMKPLSRKEKNKLASRVCRLKKKAQHEANKIKLFGLQQEHKHLLTVLLESRRLIKYKIEHFQETKNMSCFQKLDNYMTAKDGCKVAGNTTEFVNEVLEKVAKGDAGGGLGKL